MAGRALRRFHLPFEILTNDKLEAARTGKLVSGKSSCHRAPRQAVARLSRDPDVQ
jgi:hypothetical protein